MIWVSFGAFGALVGLRGFVISGFYSMAAKQERSFLEAHERWLGRLSERVQKEVL